MKKYIPKNTNNPIQLSPTTWLYVDKNGINVINEIRIDAEFIRTDDIRIPFGKFMKTEKKGKR